MRILLDESLDWRLSRDLPGHQVDSVPLLGWAGIQDRELLEKANAMEFDVFVTMESNMLRRQKVARYKIAVITLRGKSNRLDNTRPLMSQLLTLLPQLKPGTLTFLPES